MTMHTGSCSCGHIAIRAACEPQTVSMCHCLLCQKRTGSTYSVHAYFPTEHVTVQGTTNVYARKGDSGGYVYFHFCPECGATMYWRSRRCPARGVFPSASLRSHVPAAKCLYLHATQAPMGFGSRGHSSERRT